MKMDKTEAKPVPFKCIDMFRDAYTRGWRIVEIVYNIRASAIVQKVMSNGQSWQDFKKTVKIAQFISNWCAKSEELSKPYENRLFWVDAIQDSLRKMDHRTSCPRWKEIATYIPGPLLQRLRDDPQLYEHYKKHYPRKKSFE